MTVVRFRLPAMSRTMAASDVLSQVLVRRFMRAGCRASSVSTINSGGPSLAKTASSPVILPRKISVGEVTRPAYTVRAAPSLITAPSSKT